MSRRRPTRPPHSRRRSGVSGDDPGAIDSRINPPRCAYHYTDAAGIAGILADGLIRARPTVLYADLAFTRVARITEPLVWLSINPHMEMTTFVKFSFDKFSLDGVSPIGSIHRVAIPYGYAGDLSVPEYCDLRGLHYEHWRWNAYTGQLAGSDWTTWRLVPGDIPRSDWLGVERLVGVEEDGFRWNACEEDQ